MLHLIYRITCFAIAAASCIPTQAKVQARDDRFKWLKLACTACSLYTVQQLLAFGQ